MYKHIECEQGSERWLHARLGIPTASRFGCIVTPKGIPVTGKTRSSYMAELLSERLTNKPPDNFTSAAMERGSELESEAREWYESELGVTVKEFGFINAGRYGCSPDGLVFNDGGVEIKVPKPANHIKHLIANKVPDEWVVQIHGCMLVCERDWWDFVCYCDIPGVPSMIQHVERNEVMIGTLRTELEKFCDELDATEQKIRERYKLPERSNIDLDELNPKCESEQDWNELEEMEATEL